MADDAGERTEAATPRRREQARNRGQVAISRDLSAAVILLTAIIAFQNFGMDMVGAAVKILRYCLQEPWMEFDLDRVRIELTKLVLLALSEMAGWFLMVFFAALAVNVYQAGGIVIATEKNYFNIGALNPISGLKRIFSLRSVARTGIDIAKVTVVTLVAFLFFMREIEPLASLVNFEFPEMAAYAFERAIVLAYQMVAILFLLGIVDFIYQRYQHEKDLRMTKQEVKEEYKDLEGDPAIRARRRRIQAEMAYRRMMKEVPEAEVVITNPTELAIALKYDPDENDAPLVVAKGADFVAARIREIAKAHNIPLVENKPLAQMLYKLVDIGRPVPEKSFRAIAEILAYVYQLKNKPLPPRSEEERTARTQERDRPLS